MTDEVLSVDLESLRIREIEEIEERTGCAFDDLFADGKPKGTALRALGFVTKRRVDPEFSWEQAGELILRVEDTADPPEAG